MSSEWTIGTLKEHYDAFFIEKDKALNAALTSLNERLGLLNELRGGVATKEEIKALEKIVDDLKASRDTGVGKGIGNRDVMDIIKLIILVAAFFIGYFVLK